MSSLTATPAAISRTGTSLFVNGSFRRRRGVVAAAGPVLGFLMTYAWSATAPWNG